MFDPLKSQRLTADHETLSFELLITRAIQKTPQTLQAIVIAFGCPPKVEGKSIQKKMPCALDMGPRGLGLDIARSQTVKKSIFQP